MPPKPMVRLLLPLCLVAWASHAWAQEGGAPMPLPPSRGGMRIRVADSRNGDPVIEARVEVVKGGKGTYLTDVEGRTEIDVPSGEYELRITADFYRPRRVAVTLMRGAPTVIIRLRADDDVVQEVVVVGRPDTSTEAVQIVRRQKSATVSDAISAEQISRSPDSSAGDAVKRVVAATVQDGKYVVVRGLGGRYTSTLLNGVPLPSPDPDNPAAPLDLFPAAMLANLTVAKTFNPDIPGNFAGGSLSIETREFPSDFTLKLKMSTGVDTVSSFREANSSRGGNLDFLGYDDGTRAMPAMPDRRVVTSGQGAFTNDELSTIARSFDNNWELSKTQASPAIGLNATIGDTLTRDGGRFGYLASFTYGNKWTRRLQDSRTVLNAMEVNQDFDVDLGMQQTALGGLVNLGFEPSPGQRLGAISFYSHSSEDSSQVASGISDPEAGTFRQRTRLRFLERTLAFGQLSGTHGLAANEKLTLGWQGNVSFVSQDEPDVRDVTYIRDANGELRFDSSAGSGDRYLRQPLRSVRRRQRRSHAGAGGLQAQGRRLGAAHHPRATGAPLSLPPPSQRGHERPALPRAAREPVQPRQHGDAHPRRGSDAQRRRLPVHAQHLCRLRHGRPPVARATARGHRRAARDRRLVAARFHQVRDQPGARPPTERLDIDVLPAINTILSLGAAQNLRASYSMTVARPHVREIAPFAFNDYARGRVLSGNPEVITRTFTMPICDSSGSSAAPTWWPPACSTSDSSPPSRR
jgi:hypothetical protein